MVSSSLLRLGAKAAGEAVGVGGWSYAKIVEHLSPAVSKFSVSEAGIMSGVVVISYSFRLG